MAKKVDDKVVFVIEACYVQVLMYV